MGDRCYLVVNCKKADQARVDQAISGGYGANQEEPIEGAEDVIRLEYEEVNYGACDDRDALAKEGIVFVGSSSEGSSYPAFEFASVNGEQLEVVTSDGTPMARLDPVSLTLAAGEAEFLARFKTHREAACAALGLTVTWDAIPQGGGD